MAYSNSNKQWNITDIMKSYNHLKDDDNADNFNNKISSKLVRRKATAVEREIKTVTPVIEYFNDIINKLNKKNRLLKKSLKEKEFNDTCRRTRDQEQYEDKISAKVEECVKYKQLCEMLKNENKKNNKYKEDAMKYRQMKALLE